MKDRMTKRDLVIEKEVPRHFMQYICPHTPLSFHATQIINPHLNLSFSANYDT